MRNWLSAIAAISCAALAAPTLASTLVDPADDFLSTYTGAEDPDLDVTSFGVLYDAGTMNFTLSASFAGPIDTSLPGFYVIGVNTGTPTNSFASIGAGNVRFNRTIIIQKTGVATIAGVPLAGGPALISGSSLTALVSLAALSSTGFTPEFYGFNIWPRSSAPGVSGPAAISDFAPDNATLAAVPEPATWATMLLGFGAIGLALRRGKRTVGDRRSRVIPRSGS